MTYFLVTIFILLSGLFSGLNLGLMGLNSQELKRKARLGNKDAKKIYPLRKQGNFLLVTLLLGNVAVNAVIAILLGSITSGVIAGVISTALITIFGEIIPQATFSRYALKLGAKCTFIVKMFMYTLYPITKPIAWTLDKTLGEELNTVYSRRELLEIIQEHKQSEDSDIREEEEKIVRGALSFASKQAHDVMTPASVVSSYEEDEEIDKELRDELVNSSFSRFPVTNRRTNEITGVLHLRDVFRSKPGAKLKDLATPDVLFVRDTDNLVRLFNKLIQRKHPFAVVQDEFDTVVGVITLEDIIEEIIQDEIVDEYDKVKDLREMAK